MILNLKKKEKIVCKLHEVAKKSVLAVIANLKGVKVNEINQLRKEARDTGVFICVIRNTLLRRVLENTSFLCLKDILIGQNVIAFSNKTPSESVRMFIKFNKKNKFFKIKGAVFEGTFIDSSQIEILSNFPTYKESVFNLVLVMKGIIGNLIRVLYMLSIKQHKL